MSFDARDFVANYMPFINMELTENNLLNGFVKPMLVDLGYDSSWFGVSNKESEKIIHFNVTDTQGENLAVLVNYNINEDIMVDYKKAISFLGREDYTWVIFTNGIQWLLLNQEIKRMGNEYIKGENIVAHVEITHAFRGEKSPEMFKLFTYQSLLSPYGSTIYYRDLQQFKVFHYKGNESSWRQYRQGVTLLIRYITSLKKRSKGYYRMSNGHEFIDLIRWAASQDTHRSKGSRQLSESYIKSVYRWLNSFFKVMNRVGFYKHNPLDEMTIDQVLQVQELSEVILRKKEDIQVDLKRIVGDVLYLMSRERDGERNQLAFLLLLYGLDREEVTSLRWENYNQLEKSITLPGKPPKNIDLKNAKEITTLIEQVRNNLIAQGVKTEWIICKSNGEKLTATTLTHYTINRKIQEVSRENLTIENIQQSIFKTTIKESRDAFTILYLRGWDTSRLQNLIEKEDIVDMVDFDKMMQHHPLRRFL